MRKVFLSLVIWFCIINIYAQDFSKKYNSSTQKWAIQRLTKHDTTLITDYVFDYLPNYDWSGNSIASANGKWFFMNKKIKVISDSFDYMDTLSFEQGWPISAKLGDYWYIYNWDFKLVKKGVVHDSNFFYVHAGSENVFLKKQNDKIYFRKNYNDKWRTVEDTFYGGNNINVELESSVFRSREYFPVKKMYWGYIDINGNTKIPFKYIYTEGFNFNRGLVNTGNGWGYIDTTGKFMIEPKFSMAKSFVENYYLPQSIVPVAKNNLWGYIDIGGNTIIDFLYDEANYFNGKVAWVKYKGKYGTIGLDGKSIISFVYDYLPSSSFYNRYIVVKNGKYGLIGANGEVLINFDYDLISSQMFKTVNLQAYIVIKSGKYGLIRPFRGDERDILIPFEYDWIFMTYDENKHSYYLKLEKNGEMFEFRGGGVIKIKGKKKKKL